MSAMSNYLERKVLDHVLGTTSFPMPATVYVGLATNSLGDDNSGTEVISAGYTRKPITFLAASTGATENDSVVEFDPALTNWGAVSHFGIFDAATGGNLLIHGAFQVSKVIDTGDILRISAGDMTVAAD